MTNDESRCGGESRKLTCLSGCVLTSSVEHGRGQRNCVSGSWAVHHGLSAGAHARHKMLQLQEQLLGPAGPVFLRYLEIVVAQGLLKRNDLIRPRASQASSFHKEFWGGHRCD